MRQENIELNLKIVFPIMTKDLNGAIYSEQAVKKAVDKADNLPIILYDKDGKEYCIGFADTISLVKEMDEVFVNAKGRIRTGGTCESIGEINNETKVIEDMTFTGIGISLK